MEVREPLPVEQQKIISIIHNNKLAARLSKNVRSRSAKKNLFLISELSHLAAAMRQEGDTDQASISQKIVALLQQKELWQKFIDTYFSCLKNIHWEDYQHNPVQLFGVAFNYFRGMIAAKEVTISVELMLMALSGNESELTPKKVKRKLQKELPVKQIKLAGRLLYLLAAMNGHLFAIQKLNEEELTELLFLVVEHNNESLLSYLLTQTALKKFEAIAPALKLAGEKERLRLVQIFIDHSRCELSTLTAILDLFRFSVEKEEHLPLLNCLLEKVPALKQQMGAATSILDNCMEEIFIHAAKHGQLASFECLYNTLGANITMSAKGSALRVAAQNNQAIIVNFLLESLGENIPQKDLLWLLNFSSKTNERVFFLRSLLQAKIRLPNEKIEASFLRAVSRGNLAVVECFYHERRDAISSPVLGLALRRAAKKVRIYSHSL